MEVQIEQLVGKYVELRDAVERITAEAKDALAKQVAPMQNAMQVIQGELMKRANAQGVTSFKTSAGTAFITTKTECGVQDWDATIAHILETGNTALLNHAVNKTAVQQYINLHEKLPPGVKWNVTREIQVRRS